MERTFALFSRLCRDEAGFVSASHYVLLVTILGIGMIAGLSAVRDSLVSEFGEVAAGLEQLDQSYAIDRPMGTTVLQFGFTDQNAGDDSPEPPGAIELNRPAEPE